MNINIYFQISHKVHLIQEHDPGHGICECIKSCKARVVILGSRGQGKLRRTILGSVSDYVVHHADCTVIIVPAAKQQQQTKQ